MGLSGGRFLHLACQGKGNSPSFPPSVAPLVRDWWKLEIMNLTSFHPKRKWNMENKNNSPVNIRFVAKTSDMRIFSQNCNANTAREM